MMNRETLEELACDRLVELVDQAFWHQISAELRPELCRYHDNEIDKLICLAEASELKDAMDDEDYDVLYMTYHRYLSESFGVEFEQEHGDEELMFGGV